MEIIQSPVSKNRCYKKKTPLKVRGLMLHSVGCAQPKATVFVNGYNNALKNACVHGFIDASTGDFYQTLPFEYVACHAGGSANSTHIGIEMCEPPTSCIKYTGGAKFKVINQKKAMEYVTTAYNSAVILFAQLCIKYNLDPTTAIISHNEGRLKKVASGHVDPEHLWTQLGCSYTMNGFRADVKAYMNGTPITPPTPTPVNPEPSSDHIFNGVDLNPVYSATFYADKYADLKNAFGYNDALLFQHFCKNGMNEARQAISTFDPIKYRQNYPDLDKAFGDSWMKYYAHYCTSGIKEGRKGV